MPEHGVAHLTGLERAIIQTITYFDLYQLPLTATQIWRGLLVNVRGTHVGHGVYTLAEITAALQRLVALPGLLETKWGYYCLAGRVQLIPERLARFRCSQEKWRILQRVVRWLTWVPFVRMLAGSGSLAWANTTPQSDLDVLVVADHRRLWTARALLLVITELTGRRRRAGQIQAPDRVCLNHYLTDDHLSINPEIRHVYSVMQYLHIVPLLGLVTYQEFQLANQEWLRRFVTYPVPPLLPRVQQLRVSRGQGWLQRQLELWLLEPIGAVLEHYLSAWQRWTITHHTRPHQAGRVVVSAEELAFHPDSRAGQMVGRLQQRLDG